MKRHILTIAFLFTVMIFPVFAHEDVVHHVQADAFGFNYAEDTVHITHVPTGIDTFPPAPAHTMIEVIHEPELEGEIGYQATIRVYRTEDVAGFVEYNQAYEKLQAILTDRPDLAQYTEAQENQTENALP